MTILKPVKIQKEPIPNLSKLALAIHTLPYSSASIERLFSDMGNIKTDPRNRLSVENLEASLLIRQEYKGKNNYYTKEMKELYYLQSNTLKRSSSTDLE